MSTAFVDDGERGGEADLEGWQLQSRQQRNGKKGGIRAIGPGPRDRGTTCPTSVSSRATGGCEYDCFGTERSKMAVDYL